MTPTEMVRVINSTIDVMVLSVERPFPAKRNYISDLSFEQFKEWHEKMSPGVV